VVIRKQGAKRRDGAVTVEIALVIIVVSMFVFSVFEYGRLLMDWNVLNNAARQGCRFALVNNTDPTITTDVQTIVTNSMGGRNSAFSGFTVTVSGTHGGVSTPVNNLIAGDFITVNVTGQYKFLNVIPLIRLSSSFSITSAVTMLCEGGT
jgi:Flp pilus assembly protein TadG